MGFGEGRSSHVRIASEKQNFKNMLLDERGNLVFMAVGTGSEMFSSGRRGSFERVYTVVYVVSCPCRVIPIRTER